MLHIGNCFEGKLEIRSWKFGLTRNARVYSVNAREAMINTVQIHCQKISLHTAGDQQNCQIYKTEMLSWKLYPLITAIDGCILTSFINNVRDIEA